MARVCLLRDGSISICHLFSRYTTCSQWKSATRKVTTFSGEGFRVVLKRGGSPVGRMPNSCCPAAGCDTSGTNGSARFSWEIKQVFNNSLLVTIFSSRFVFFGWREKSWNYQKWHVSEWPWFRLLNDCSSLRCNSSILVLCAGDMQRHAFLRQGIASKIPKVKHVWAPFGTSCNDVKQPYSKLKLPSFVWNASSHSFPEKSFINLLDHNFGYQFFLNNE